MYKNNTVKITEIIKEYHKGKSLRQVAKKYNINRHRVQLILKEQGIFIRKHTNVHKCKLTEKQIKQICIEYISGNTSIYLSKKYGVSDTTIRKYLNKNNISRKRKISQDEENKICIDYISGKSVNDMTYIYNLPLTNIYRILHKNKVKINPIAENLQKEVGKIYGDLTVVEEYIENNNNKRQRYFKCKCKCGKFITVYKYYVTRGHKKSCGCQKKTKNKSTYSGCGEISGRYWNKVKSNEKKRGIEFIINIEYAWELFEKQNRKCVLSDIPISFENRSGSSASLDRIDSSKGYIYGNVQWVFRDINLMKSFHDETYFINLCKAVANKN